MQLKSVIGFEFIQFFGEQGMTGCARAVKHAKRVRRIHRVFQTPPKQAIDRTDSDSCCEANETLRFSAPVILPQVILNIAHFERIAGFHLFMKKLASGSAFDVFYDELRRV